METTKQNINPKKLTLVYEHNPYTTNVYVPKKQNGKIVLFPVFNYQGDAQYIDLIKRLVDEGFKVITIAFLNKGDRVLFFGYYYQVFAELVNDLQTKKLLANSKKNEELIVLGFGLGANLASSMLEFKSDEVKISKILLLSPVNRYKGEYRVSNVIKDAKIPTFIFFGQFDKVTENDRFSIFEKGKDNPNVHFFCYPATGHYLYYNGPVSMDLDKIYRSSDFDQLVGESRKSKQPFLPSEDEPNVQFYKHFFNALNDVPNKKKIALLIDVYPLFINGVVVVVEQLRDELNKLGYETYIVSLWKKGDDFQLLPNDHTIPVIASYAKMIKGYKDLYLLKADNVKKNARELALFGFDYLHLHTEYSMSSIAIELSKYTDIKMPYTYHTIWRMYYQHKFGTLMGDVTYETGKTFLFNRIYKTCPIITVPSIKSYDIVKSESQGKDVRILPTPINIEKFTLSREDRSLVAKLKNEYGLKGKKVLGYVGRVSTEKNITETISFISRVAGEIPNLVFVIVGVGDATEELKKISKKLGVEDKIIYVGQVPNDELKLYYALFDVFVTASNFETQGLTYFEAAASGTLILAKQDKAIEGLLVDGVNAYIYENFYQWTEKLEKALFRDNKKIIESAKSTVKKFTLSKWVKTFQSIYKELNPDK